MWQRDSRDRSVGWKAEEEAQAVLPEQEPTLLNQSLRRLWEVGPALEWQVVKRTHLAQLYSEGELGLQQGAASSGLSLGNLLHLP